ncbi:MAG: NHLP family bacteriocin export ABC transporter peptidase/permease/ATPase subunit [Gemmatimonadota bacterium]|nr:NHLP family bacteriocin export ABC transporter peptidase/permease/ATPase subunit [Gemmatimonadota bacterium]
MDQRKTESLGSDPELRPNLRSDRGGRFRTPTILQMETTECAAACLGIILAYHGRWVPLEALRVRCGVSRDGANAANMLKAAREYGLVARGFRSQHEQLFDVPFPMVVFWEFNHFVVLEGIRGDRVYINDPGEGPRRITRQEFSEGFSGVCFGFAPSPRFSPGGPQPNLVRGLRDRFGDAGSPFAFAALATLALVVPGVAVPTLIKVFIDDVLIGQNSAWVSPLLFGLALAAVAQGALTWLQRILLARMETKLSVISTVRFFWHVATLPMLFFSQRYAGDIASRVASNDSVARLLSGELAVSAINILTMVFYALVMLSYDVPLTLIALAMVAANLIVLRFAARARENANRRLLKERGRVAGASINGIRIIETFKANGTEDDFFARWSGIHANALRAQQSLSYVSTVANVAPVLLSALTAIIVLGYGGIRILDGALSIGGLIAFQSLTLSFSRPVEGLVRFGASLQLIRADIGRLDDVLNYAPDERTRRGINTGEPVSDAPVPRGSIDLEGVTFGYNATEPPLIEDFSLSIRPGRRVALVGASGSGKSTVARIVCGLLTPWSGTVRVDGQAFEDIPPYRFAEIVSYVDQEVILFEASVRENVTLWDPDLEERDVVQALRDAAIHDIVSTRPLKYDCPVSEGGRNFSGGQRQRLEIARALVRNPAVLVLDEATAALDPITEVEIDDRIRRRGCTCLIIAHRLSTIRDADHIVVLDRGRIVQRGTHDSLIAEDGLYRTLVMSD